MLIPKPVGMDFAISPKTGQRKTWLPRLLPEKLDAAKSGPKKVESAIEKVESAIEKVESASQKSGIRKPKKWNPHCGFQKNALRTASAPLKKVESAPRKVKSATKKAKAARENLDRNRYLACQKLGIEPKFEHWDGEGSPEEIVLSLNLHRRHLSSAQRAAIAVEVLPRLEAGAKERQRESGQKHGREKVNQKVDEPIDPEQTTENNDVNDDSKSEQKAKRTKGEDVSEQSLDRAAKMFATNHNYVWWAKLIKDADPALLRKIRDGEMKIAVARRKLTRRRFPTPKQARRLALAENRSVLARDGRRYGPPGEDPEKPPELDPSEQEALAFVDAVVTLGTLTLGPDDLAGKIPSWRRDEVENHLGNAISCLWAFDNEWNLPDGDGG